MESRVKAEALLRLFAALMLILSACLTRTNSQSKLVFGFYEKTAKSSDLKSFVIAEYIFIAAASYNLLQVIRCFFSLSPQNFARPKPNSTVSYKLLAWLSFLLDQITAYIVFTVNSTASAEAAVALTGVESLQWIKWCNTYTRFCYQAGGHIICAFVAWFFLAGVAAISASNVFSFYSPKHFLYLKKVLIK
ncbi:hypothetical protein Dimus_025736 [Dionaea muscipula]